MGFWGLRNDYCQWILNLEMSNRSEFRNQNDLILRHWLSKRISAGSLWHFPTQFYAENSRYLFKTIKPKKVAGTSNKEQIVVLAFSGHPNFIAFLEPAKLTIVTTKLCYLTAFIYSTAMSHTLSQATSKKPLKQYNYSKLLTS